MSSAAALKQISKLSKQGANRQCVECNSPSLYLVTKYGHVFVCIRCAGIHRCFMSGMYVKGLTTANFSQVDVDALREGGNAKSRRLYMAKHNGTCPSHSSTAEEMKSFVKNKYLKKQWYSESSVKAAQLTRSVNTNKPTKKGEEVDFFASFGLPSAPSPRVSPESHKLPVSTRAIEPDFSLMDELNPVPAQSSADASKCGNTWDLDDWFNTPISTR